MFKQKKKDDILKITRLSFPIMIQNLGLLIMQFIDSAMVGNLGAIAVTSVAISISPMWFIEALMMIIGTGSMVLVARYIGAKEMDKAGIVTGFAFYASIVLGSIIMIITLLWGSYLPVIMGAEKDVVPTATQYLLIISLSFIPRFVLIVLTSIFRGAGNTKIPMYVGVFVNIINIIGNILLIYPTRTLEIFNIQIEIWGAGFGVIGAGIATSFSILAAGTILFFIMVYKENLIKIKLTGLIHEIEYLKRILKIGLPASVEKVLRVMGQLVFFRIVALFGTVAFAANHLAIVIESLSYMPAEGFSNAATTLVGQSLGQKDTQKAQKYADLSFILCLIFMTFLGIIFFIFPEFLMSIFTKDREVIDIGIKLLKIVAFMQPFFACYIVYAGVLRGAGDTKSPMKIALISKTIIRIAFTLLFYFLGFGIVGAWYAMLIDQTTHGLLIFRQYKKEKWKTIEI